jgi:two-component system NarL family sensor kinase
MGRQVVVRQATGRIVTATAQDVGRVGEAWPLLLLSPWFFLFGVLLLLRAKPALIGVMAFALFGLAAEVLALGPIADCNRFALGPMAERVVIPCFGASFAGFFLIYPTVRILRPHLWAAAFLPAALAAALGILGTAVPSIYPFSNTAWLALLMFYLALGVGLAVQAFVRPPDAAARRGLRAIAVATALAVLPFVTLSLAPLLLGLPQLLHAEHAALAAAWLPSGYSYATLRHDALKVQFVQRWLAHGVLCTGMICLYGLVAFAFFLQTGLRPLSSPDLAVLTVLLAVVVSGSFPRLYLSLQRAVDQRLFKDDGDYYESLCVLSERMSTGAMPESQVDTLPATLKDLMKLEFVSLFERRHGNLRMRGSAGTAPDDLLRTADCALGCVHDPRRLMTRLTSGGIVLLAPLATQGVTVGCLCLGSKQNGEPLRVRDEKPLLTLAGHLAMTILTVQLTDELRSQFAMLDALHSRLEGAQEQERERQASEIHDGSLQTALHLQRLITEDADARTVALQLDLSRMLVTQLRTVCMKVRPVTFDEFGLAAALEVLVIDLRRHTCHEILVDADPAIAAISLPANVQSVLYRAAQEALNNALKHAQAATLLVTLRYDTGAVELCVADDGCGFSVPSSLDCLVAAGHLGLAGLQQCVRRSEGFLEVASQLKLGTTVKVRLSVPGGE